MIKKYYEKPMMRVLTIQDTRMLMSSDVQTLSGHKGATDTDDLWYDLE